ncbi:uncharacterized protein METZ01_LOCUS165578 [marine metagenome]|uniref:Uncharacterized protein n=1 Tax=marine metagenome TaxID=408172 RepID=A0A382BGE2_9ZZZZ
MDVTPISWYRRMSPAIWSASPTKGRRFGLAASFRNSNW